MFLSLLRNLFSPLLPVDAVEGTSLLVPTVAVEGRNVSLRCTWTAGTEITVQWGKGGATISPDARISITGDALVITPAQRSDAGEYTCTASNAISAQTATRSITVYCEFTVDGAIGSRCRHSFLPQLVLWIMQHSSVSFCFSADNGVLLTFILQLVKRLAHLNYKN